MTKVYVDKLPTTNSAPESEDDLLYYTRSTLYCKVSRCSSVWTRASPFEGQVMGSNPIIATKDVNSKSLDLKRSNRYCPASKNNTGHKTHPENAGDA